jgi:hypothetical protein
MLKLIAIAAAGVSTLALAAPAAGKELTLLRVCGADGCNAITSGGTVGHDGGPSFVSRPSLQGYYLLRIGAGDGKRVLERWDMYFVPDPGAIIGTQGGNEGWTALPARATKAVKAAAKGLKPFRTPQIAEAYVGEHRSVDPAAYTALLGPLEEAGIPSTLESPISLSFDWQRPNPWSNDGGMMNYLVKARMLMRGDGYFRVPDALARRLDREHRGLAPVVPGGGFPWAVFVGSMSGAVVLAGLLVALARRRRPRPAERPVPA